MSKIIAVVNQKGGVAKTTTANALGIGLANRGYRILLIDLDPQGNLSMSLGVSFPDMEQKTISELLLSQIRNNTIEQECLPDYIHSDLGVDFLVGNDDLGKVDKIMSGFRGSEYALSKILSKLKSSYDFIIVDCMPSIGNLTENAVVASDEIIVPSEPQYFSVKGIQSLFDEISAIRRRSNPKLRIAGVLPTKVDSRTGLSHELLELINTVFADTIKIFSPIPISIKLAECSDGKSIYEYDRTGKGVQAYINFVDEFLSEVQ